MIDAIRGRLAGEWLRRLWNRLVTDERAVRHCLRAGERHLVVRTRSEEAFRKAARARLRHAARLTPAVPDRHRESR